MVQKHVAWRIFVLLVRKQDLVFSVKLHLGLIPYPLTLDPYPLSLPLFPYPLVLFLSFLLLLLLLLLILFQAKVKSTPNPWPKTWSSTMT